MWSGLLALGCVSSIPKQAGWPKIEDSPRWVIRELPNVETLPRWATRKIVSKALDTLPLRVSFIPSLADVLILPKMASTRCILRRRDLRDPQRMRRPVMNGSTSTRTLSSGIDLHKRSCLVTTIDDSGDTVKQPNLPCNPNRTRPYLARLCANSKTFSEPASPS